MNEVVTRLGLMVEGDIVLDEAAVALAALDHDAIDESSYRQLLASMASSLGHEDRDAHSAGPGPTRYHWWSPSSSGSLAIARATMIRTTRT